jgi:hypothetical protein
MDDGQKTMYAAGALSVFAASRSMEGEAYSNRKGPRRKIALARKSQFLGAPLPIALIC